MGSILGVIFRPKSVRPAPGFFVMHLTTSRETMADPSNYHQIAPGASFKQRQPVFGNGPARNVGFAILFCAFSLGVVGYAAYLEYTKGT